MEPVEFNASAMVASINGAFQQGSALLVQYSFSIVGAIIVLVVGFIVAGLVERWSYRGLKSIRGFDETLRRFFSKILRYAVLLVVGVMVLGQFGVQTASVLAAMGAIGLAIGLALQGTLQNIAAGIMLLVLRPFKAGEYVDAGDVSGTIQEIGLFATELKTFDGIYVLAPNSELWKSPVKNYTRNATRMNEIKIGIGYDDDIDAAQAIYQRIAGSDTRILHEPEPKTFVSELGDSAVAVSVRYWTRTSDWFQTKLDFTKQAKIEFDKAGISIPYPQQEIRYVPQDDSPLNGGGTQRPN